MRQRVYLASKFIVPSASREVVLVKGFLDKIRKSVHFPLTLIKAGPGYGKSTLLGFYFKNFAKNYYWFNLSGEDNELYNFIYNLIHSVRINRSQFGESMLKTLEETEKLQKNWSHIINMFINGLWEIHGESEEDIFLVIEDLHRVQENKEILDVLVYLADNLPPGIHLVATSRFLPTSFPWQQWKLKGKVLLLSEEDLAFGPEEVRSFFALRTGKGLENRVIDLLLAKTEGWVIALEMLSESFNLEKIEDLDESILDNSQELFAYLALDILDKQEEELRHFLLSCSVLNFLNSQICEFLLGPDGPRLMREVVEKELFINYYGKSNYRFHSLFRDFLSHAAVREGYPVKELHHKAARYFLQGEHVEDAVNHLIKAGDFSQASQLIIKMSPDLIKGARYNTLQYWLKNIPASVYNSFPWLYVVLGDIHRYKSDFYQALDYYEKAEKLEKSFESEVLQRKALVYLDTVQPSRAEPLLSRALELKEKEEDWRKAGLLALIAENDLNRGKIAAVRALQEKARDRQIELPVNIQVRLLLRTGKLFKAIALLENKNKQEGTSENISPQAHRETRLILSLLLSLTGGDTYSAYSLAREGFAIGQRVGAPFTECVAAARIGHTYLVRDKLDKAIHWYLQANSIAEELRISRGKGEPLWCLCLAYGLRGQWELAFRYGEEGRRICLEASDFWLVSLINLSLGIGCISSERFDEALEYIREGRKLAEQCEDPFLVTVSLLWEALTYWKRGEKDKLNTVAGKLYEKVDQYGYQFLITGRSLWSPRDPALLQAMLGDCPDLSRLTGGYLPQVKKPSYHPGYTLELETLGSFKVRRGYREIKNEEWTREKARRLLQVLVGFRGSYVRSEQLIDILWPEKSREQGRQNLKVIINSLNGILEPGRGSHSPFFVERNNLGYGLVHTERIRVDADEFLNHVQAGLQYYQRDEYELAREALEGALELYKGEFLPELAYEEWVLAERELLRKNFLEGAEKLAQIYLNSKEWSLCLGICENILSADCCRENTFRIMIICYCQMKEKILAVQAYQRCKENLAKHLGVKPSQKLVNILKENIAGL